MTFPLLVLFLYQHSYLSTVYVYSSAHWFTNCPYLWKCMEKYNHHTKSFAKLFMKVLYAIGQVYDQMYSMYPQWLRWLTSKHAACYRTYFSHGSCYMKNTSYKTNQTDSLQMATKVSCDPIWSTAYLQIVCGATQRFHKNNICSAYDPAAMPYSTVQQPGQCYGYGRALLWNTVMKKISQGEGEIKDIDVKCNVMVYMEKEDGKWHWHHY